MVSEALQAACDSAIRSSRRGDTRLGVELARQAYRLARQESPEAELEALNACALCQTANGAFIESIATSIDVIDLSREHENRRAAAHALTTMAGAASFILNADDVVLEMLQVCRSEANALADTAIQVRVNNSFGLVYGNLSRFDDADREYDQGIAMVTKANERGGLYTPGYLMVGNKAFLAVQRARAATKEDLPRCVIDAEQRIDYALKLATAEVNIDAEARALFCLGQLRALEGRRAEALSAFGEALTRATQIRHYPRLIDTNIEISQLLVAQSQHEMALEAMEAAYGFADSSRPTAKVAIACEGIASIYAKLGRSREAEHYQARATRERDAFDRERGHAVHDLQSFWRTVAT